MRSPRIFVIVCACLAACFVAASASAQSLLVKAPSDVVVGQKFTVEVVPMAKNGDPNRGFSGKVSLRVPGRAEAVDVPMTRQLNFPDTEVRLLYYRGSVDARLDKPGWQQLVVTSGDLTTLFPLRVHATAPKQKLYWGEIHTHSGWDRDAGDGLDPDKTYTWGRNVACLDFGTVVAHHWSFGEDKWQELAKITNKRNEPGRFVTIVGYEWGQGDQPGSRWNHNNVYFLADTGPWAPNMKSINEFWPWLEKNSKVPTLCIPHHPALAGIRTQWDTHNSKFQPVVEVYSTHGNSESKGAALQGKCNYEPGYVQNALARGAVMGFIAGSDNHGGRMGTNSVAGNRQRSEPNTGLAAIYADELTRKGLWEGLKSRYTYGTSGAQRILLEFNINGHRMGEVFDGGDAPRKITAEVGGTADIATIELIRNNVVVHTAKGAGWHETLDYVDAKPDEVNWYYIRVTQTDGNLAWSSPIWVKR